MTRPTVGQIAGVAAITEAGREGTALCATFVRPYSYSGCIILSAIYPFSFVLDFILVFDRFSVCFFSLGHQPQH